MKKNKKLKTAIFLILVLSLAAWLSAGCSAGGQSGDDPLPESADDGYGADDAYSQKEETQDENPDYAIKYINLEEAQKSGILRKLSHVMEQCAPIYRKARKDATPDAALDEEDVHQMVSLIAGEGNAVICGSRDENMKNYEKVDQSIRSAKKGKNTQAEFYSVNVNGIFRYYKLEFEGENLFVTFASAVYQGSVESGTDQAGETAHTDMTPAVQQIEKICTYQWDYTEKGWLIWEKALSRNQEMDMHVFYRILPLDRECRRLLKNYIEPVSYFSNNLFLTDWDANHTGQLEFNDLFDSFYYMSSGRRPDKNTFQDGIPKKEFEKTIQRYLNVETKELERRASYDQGKETYPWLAITAWNRLPQLQPFPEVTDYKKNKDGTLDVYVDAVFVEEGTDCSFSHVVTVKEQKDGSFVYLGNKIDHEHVLYMPAYRPRQDF